MNRDITIYGKRSEETEDEGFVRVRVIDEDEEDDEELLPPPDVEGDELSPIGAAELAQLREALTPENISGLVGEVNIGPGNMPMVVEQVLDGVEITYDVNPALIVAKLTHMNHAQRFIVLQDLGKV